MKLVTLEGVLYRVEQAKNGCLRLKPMEVKNLEKKAKNEILKQFDADELMEEIINKANEPRNEKVIIERLGD